MSVCELGCKVCVECEDRVWRHGTVLGLRSKFGHNGPESGQMFSVKMEHSSQVTAIIIIVKGG